MGPSGRSQHESPPSVMDNGMGGPQRVRCLTRMVWKEGGPYHSVLSCSALAHSV
jgi:hypothetical protein